VKNRAPVGRPARHSQWLHIGLARHNFNGNNGKRVLPLPPRRAPRQEVGSKNCSTDPAGGGTSQNPPLDAENDGVLFCPTAAY